MIARHRPVNAGRVPVERLRVHQAIVDRLALTGGETLLDLGCGNGFTLAVAASRVAGLSLIGIDVDAGALAAAESALAESDCQCRLLVGDVGDPITLPDGSVTRVVSHDVLEYLKDPVELLVEASRVMATGALSVWSHTDYDALVIGGADRQLTRRVVTAYGDASYNAYSVNPELGHSDAQMGRKLAAVVDASPLHRTAINAAVLIATSLDGEGPGRRRIEDIVATVGGSDAENWMDQLVAADRRGEFFYSQTAYMVTAQR